jgi:hypothetical protein
MTIGALYLNFVAANFVKPRPRKMGWVKLMQEFIKLNIDASFYADDLCGAIGAVIYDSQGAFIAASSSINEHAQDALPAEI